MFSVTISEKGGQQSQYDFSKPEITIGRMKGNDIVLPKGNVSKQHTRIFLRDQNFFIVDLKSTNGTYVNGRKVNNEQPIGESDKIYIGDFILQLEHQNAQQRPGGGPPKPPSPPKPAGGGQGGGGRHFPTVMDGAQERDNPPSHTLDDQAAVSPSSPSSPSSPGVPGPSGPAKQPTPTPAPTPEDRASRRC